MNFTIIWADNLNNCDIIIDLSKSGNKFVVCVWNKATKRTEKRHETETLKNAEAVFYKWFKQYEMTSTHTTEQEWTAADFD